MPKTIAIEPEGVVITLTGIIPGDEIRDLNNVLAAHPHFVRWRYQIWDFSDAEKFEASIDQLRDFAIQDTLAARINPRQKIAIIPRRASQSGLDRVFHVMESVWGAYESKTFTNIDAARAWAAH
jgi:hypothetical protein